MRYILALAFVIGLNMTLFLVQTSTNQINPEGPQFYNFDDSLMSQFNAGNNTNFILDENVEDRIPETEASISQEETANFFTDKWNTLRNWFLDVTGAKYVIDVVTAVPNFLKIIGFPNEFVFAIGFFWYTITLFLLIMVLRGIS